MDESPVLGQNVAKLDLALSAAIADGFGIHAQELIRSGSNVFQRVFVLLVAIFRAIEEMSVGNRHIVVVTVDLGNEVFVNAEPFSAIDAVCLFAQLNFSINAFIRRPGVQSQGVVFRADGIDIPTLQLIHMNQRLFQGSDDIRDVDIVINFFADVAEPFNLLPGNDLRDSHPDLRGGGIDLLYQFFIQLFHDPGVFDFADMVDPCKMLFISIGAIAAVYDS